MAELENRKVQEFVEKKLGVSLRVNNNHGEFWFMAEDVAKALSVKNSRMMIEPLDRDEKCTMSVIDANGHMQRAVMISEAGLYSVVLRSRKDTAKAKTFKRWVAHTVIPSIRENGGYIDEQERLSVEEQEALKEEVKKLRRKVMSADLRISHLEDENAILEDELHERDKRERRESNWRLSYDFS